MLVSRMANRLEGNLGKYSVGGRVRGPKPGVTAGEGRQQVTRSEQDRRPYFSVSSREVEEYGHDSWRRLAENYLTRPGRQVGWESR
jgi:hypothetical protein